MNMLQMPASATWNVRAAPFRPSVACPHPGTASDWSRMRARSGPRPSLFTTAWGCLGGLRGFFERSRLGSGGSVIPVEARTNSECIRLVGGAGAAGSEAVSRSAEAIERSNSEPPDQRRVHRRLVVAERAAELEVERVRERQVVEVRRAQRVERGERMVQPQSHLDEARLPEPVLRRVAEVAIGLERHAGVVLAEAAAPGGIGRERLVERLAVAGPQCLKLGRRAAARARVAVE